MRTLVRIMVMVIIKMIIDNDNGDDDDDDDDDSARCLAGARAFSVARGTLDSGLSGASTVVPGRATNYTS